MSAIVRGSRLLELLVTAGCHRRPAPGPTITILGEAYPVTQIVRNGDRAYFTVNYSDTSSHRMFAFCSRAAFSGIEWEHSTGENRLPKLAFASSDSVLFSALCGRFAPPAPSNRR